MMDLEKAARNARAVAEARFELGIEGRPTAISEFLVEYKSFHAFDNVEGNNESATIERLERKLDQWCSDLGGRTIVWRQLPTFREIIDRSERGVSVTIHLRARAHCLGDVPAGYNHGAVRKCQWQPIETAPRDGTWFLGCNSNSSMAWSPYEFCAWTKDYSGREYYCEEDTSEETEATHWMPLPKPPA